jgi:hypothetical protein
MAFYTDNARLLQTTPKVLPNQRELARKDLGAITADASRAGFWRSRVFAKSWRTRCEPRGELREASRRAEDRLVQDLWILTTMKQAEYLDAEFRPWWSRTLEVELRDAAHGHRSQWSKATIWRRS